MELEKRVDMEIRELKEHPVANFFNEESVHFTLEKIRYISEENYPRRVKNTIQEYMDMIYAYALKGFKECVFVSSDKCPKEVVNFFATLGFEVEEVEEGHRIIFRW